MPGTIFHTNKKTGNDKENNGRAKNERIQTVVYS